ncbi:MAG: hypothetical protein ACRECT_03655 [Thermoplasmata archaeon]
MRDPVDDVRPVKWGGQRKTAIAEPDSGDFLGGIDVGFGKTIRLIDV